MFGGVILGSRLFRVGRIWFTMLNTQLYIIVTRASEETAFLAGAVNIV